MHICTVDGRRGLARRCSLRTGVPLGLLLGMVAPIVVAAIF
jgi:hypothetical protein